MRRSRIPMVGSSSRARCADHSPNRARSPGGRPSISAMTMTGIGRATASMRSNADGSSMASSNAARTARIRGSSALTALRGERLVHERAQPRVVGRVEEEQRELLARGEKPRLAGRERALARVACEAAGVAQDGVDVAMAGEHPGVREAAAMHGVALAHPRVAGIGVPCHAGRERVVGDPAVPVLGEAHRVCEHRSDRFVEPRQRGALEVQAGRAPAGIAHRAHENAWGAMRIERSAGGRA